MSIHVIGIIEKSIPTDDPEVFETETPTCYHVNSSELIESWEEYQVFPVTPYNVFYGVDTFYYTFDSEQHYKDVAGIVEDEEEGSK